MAHKLSNGNYRHKGVDIRREEVACSTGWCCVWTVGAAKYDTLALAILAIDLRPNP